MAMTKLKKLEEHFDLYEFCCEEQEWTKDDEEIFAGGYKAAAIFLGFVPAMKEHAPLVVIKDLTNTLILNPVCFS